MRFYYLVSEKRLVKSLTDSTSPTSFELMQSDTEDVFVHAVEQVPDDQQAEDGSLFREIPLSATTIKLWIGGIELAPTGGTWKAKVGVNETAALQWNVSRTDLETALNALASVTSAGGLTVLEKTGTPQAANYYLISWTNPLATAVVESAANALTPKSRISTYGGTDPDIKTQAVVLEQYPPLFTDQFTRPTPAVPTVARIRIGSGVQNEVQNLTIPGDSRAIYALVFNSLVTKPLPANAPSRDVAAALNALFTDGKERFTARLARRGVIELTCTGPLALTAQTLITVQTLENPSADYAFARLSLKGYRLLLEMRGLKSKAFTMELEINNGADTKTPLQIACTVRNDAIPDSVALVPPESEDPDWLEPESGSTPVHDPSQIVVGNRSYPTLIGGTTHDVGNTLAFTVTHNLNSNLLHVTLTENTGNRERIEDSVYKLKILNANQARITWNAGPAPAQDSIAVLVTAVPEVETFNAHNHFFSEIKKSPGEPDVTLDDVITAILAGQNALDVWPQIPVDKIADGSITADKLDLDSLIAALTGTGGVATEQFLAGLRELVKDSKLVENLVTALATSEALRETFSNFIERIFSSIKETTTLQESFFETLTALPGLGALLRAAFLSSLQTGGSLPPGTVIFDIPAFEFIYPPAQEIPAPATISEGIEDVETTTVDGGTTTKTSGKSSVSKTQANAAVRYDLLSPAVFEATTGADVAGVLSPTATAQKYTATATVNARTVSTRRGREWKSGTILTRKNDHWYEVRAVGTTLWAREMESEAFRIYVSRDMLYVGTRLSLAWLLQAALKGNAIGAIDMIVEIGSTADSGSITSPAWSQILDQRIPLADAPSLHQFSIAVERKVVQVAVISAISGDTIEFNEWTGGNTVQPGDQIFIVTKTFTVVSSVEFTSITVVTGTLTGVSVGDVVKMADTILTHTRYGQSSTFGIDIRSFALRVRFAHFDCAAEPNAAARGRMGLKIHNPPASITLIS